ncbi:hypothetical protein Pelo_4929 [Pelomyxa schiedti]|nr:hypothetical protein Pelo_4929 [Pelomyxa schiedti]
MNETIDSEHGLVKQPLSIVTTSHNGVDYGRTVAWSSWVTHDTPRLVAVVLHRNGATYNKILESNMFG